MAERLASAGTADPVQMSSMPPVPNVILACPAVTQPCPASDACWSPASAAIGGAPGSAGRVADDARRVDDRRQHRHRHAEQLAHPRAPPALLDRVEAGDGGVRVIGDVQRALRQHPRHPVSTVPKQRSSGSRPSSALASSQPILVADWLGARRSPCSALATMHSPTVRRSCQPSAGPIGRPVARSHTIVVARWLVMPTASIARIARLRGAPRGRR